MKSDIINNVLNSTLYVVENADFVKIKHDRLIELSKSFEHQVDSNWLQNSPFAIESLNDEEKLMFSVVFNGISFSYWGEPYWNVEYKGILHTRGSWSLVASIFRSIEEGNSLLNPIILKSLQTQELRNILRGNTEIPLLQDRVNILNRIGEVIVMSYSGKFSNFLKKYGQDAITLQDAIVSYFQPAFDDSYDYKGRKVYFNKRAQAMIESIHSIFNGKSYGNINNIEELTALADYIIPNLLRSLNVLEYSEDLVKIIDSKSYIEKGSHYEIEIRATTVWVVELIKRELASKGIRSKAQSINDYLWTIGRDVKTPFHQVRTTAY